VRLALAARARNLNGKPAAGSTQRRKRSVFYSALGYAVAQGHRGSTWKRSTAACTTPRCALQKR
jgi:hypothetical protein